jgi:SanA protein
LPKLGYSVICYSEKVRVLLQKHKLLLIAILILTALVPAGLMAAAYATIEPYSKNITTIDNARHEHVGIVLGAGITKQGKPFKELQARLDTAAQALQTGTVDKLILSGDNRYPNYNEPDAMRDYLVNVKHISRNKLQPDYAGRSTYESCERASKIFGVQHTIIFSARSHLPRALYLCQHFGITAQGIASNVEANNSTRRELLARVKAMYNVGIHGEPTVLGTPVHID